MCLHFTTYCIISLGINYKSKKIRVKSIGTKAEKYNLILLTLIRKIEINYCKLLLSKMTDNTTLYYHKLRNFQLRISKMEIPEEYKQEYLAVCKRQMQIEREKSAVYREEYQNQDIKCDICGKCYKRSYIYKHKATHKNNQNK